MATILYLSNRLVQVIETKEKGKGITVQNIRQEEAPEGSIINGLITDEDVFLAWIAEFFSRNKLPKKEITLVINSTQFNHKVLEFPKVKEAELKKMIPREFSENRTENTLFTYCALEGENSSKKQKVLVTAVEKEFLISYIGFFKQAGIEIVSIESGISALVRLFMNSPEIQKKTCLVQVLDGQEVISMLFVNGMYYYSQKNRVFDGESWEAYEKALTSVTDKLLQFVTSQQIKEPVETLYLCGEGQGELAKLMPDRKIYKGEKVITYAQELKSKNRFAYGIGCLLGKNQGTSLYKQIKAEQKEKKKRREVFSLVLPSAVVLCACLLITLVMGNSYMSGMRELRRLQKSMQETETVNAHASYKMSTASVASMDAKISEVETIWNHLMSYPTVNSAVEEILLSCAGEDVVLTMKSFQRDSGVLTMEASAKDVRSINGFIGKLQQQECFEAVEYSGYTHVSGTNTYNIHVVLCMAEGAGR